MLIWSSFWRLAPSKKKVPMLNMGQEKDQLRLGGFPDCSLGLHGQISQ